MSDGELKMSDPEKKLPETEKKELTPEEKTTAMWFGAAFVLAFVIVVFSKSYGVYSAGFFAKAFSVIVGAFLGGVGAVIGDALRRVAKPDFFITSGGMGALLWQRLFWAVGPQCIGLLIGTILGISLVLS